MRFPLTSPDRVYTMLVTIKSGIARMELNDQQTPRVKGPRKPLVRRGFLCARGFIILETVGTDGLRGWRFDSVRARSIKEAFSCGKVNRPQAQDSVSSLIAFPCSGIDPYLYLQPNGKVRGFLREFLFLSLGIVFGQGQRQRATA